VEWAFAVKLIRSTASNMAEGAQKQSSQAEQIWAAPEEMSQTIGGIARDDSTASETALMAKETASPDSCGDSQHGVHVHR